MGIIRDVRFARAAGRGIFYKVWITYFASICKFCMGFVVAWTFLFGESFEVFARYTCLWSKFDEIFLSIKHSSTRSNSSTVEFILEWMICRCSSLVLSNRLTKYWLFWFSRGYGLGGGRLHYVLYHEILFLWMDFWIWKISAILLAGCLFGHAVL